MTPGSLLLSSNTLFLLSPAFLVLFSRFGLITTPAVALSAGSSIGAALIAGVSMFICVVWLETAGEVLCGNVVDLVTPTGLIGVGSDVGAEVMVF
jgi:hypothetical protein